MDIKYGYAKRYTETLLGGPTTENGDVFSVTTSVQQVLKQNPDRVGLALINTGGNDVMVFYTGSVSSTLGIRLSANGGNASFQVKDDFTLQAREWYCIGIGGTSTLTYLEEIALA